MVGWLAAALALHADEAPVPAATPFAIKYDFEDGRLPELNPFTANGKFSVNSMGITAEKAFAGEKSLKFEVTAESGSHFTWLIPIAAPTENCLRLSCRYQVAATGKNSFGPGALLCYPAIASANGVDYFTWSKDTGGGWTWLTVDLTAFAKGRITRDGWEIQPGQVAAYMKGLVVCFTGMAPGERITLYIDDLVVEGETQAMTEEFSRRGVDQWRSVKEKHLDAIRKMEDTIAADQRFLAAYPDSSSATALFQRTARADMEAWLAITQSAGKRGYFLTKEIEAAGRREERLYRLMANVAMLDAYDLDLSVRSGRDLGDR